MRIFVLKPVAINLPFKYRGNDYPEASASKMALGMYLDQFDQLVKTVSLDNIDLYSQSIRYFITPNFYESLLLNLDKRQGPRHNTRVSRQALESLLRMGIQMEVAHLALSNVDDHDPEAALEWINENRDEIDNLERAQYSRTMHQSVNRRKQSEATDPNTIIEVDIPNLG